jgi:hypothetical protein
MTIRKGVQIDLGGASCIRRAGPRRRDVGTINSFGRRLLQAALLRTQRSMLGCRRPWVADGSGERAACHRHIIQSRPNLCLAVICRLPSEKRSHCFAFRGMAFARSPASWGGPLQQSHASCAAMLRHAAVVWTIEQRQHNGTLIGLLVAPSLRSWQSMMRYVTTCRIGCQVRSLRQMVEDRWTKSDMEGETICTQAA